MNNKYEEKVSFKHLLRRVGFNILTLTMVMFLFSSKEIGTLKYLLLLSAISILFITVYDIAKSFDVYDELNSLVTIRHGWIFRLHREVTGEDKIEEIMNLKKLIAEKCEGKIENYKTLRDYLEVCYVEKRFDFIAILPTLLTSISGLTFLSNIKINTQINWDIGVEAIFYLLIISYHVLIFSMTRKEIDRKSKSVRVTKMILNQLIEENK